MKKRLLILCLFATITGWAQKPPPNYDKSKIPAYTLPDPLTNAAGKKTTNKAVWESTQRNYILQLFQQNVYGKMPDNIPDLQWKVLEENDNALSGKALRRQVLLRLGRESKAPEILVLMYLPKSSKPVPVFLMPNFKGNQTISYDENIIPGKHILKPQGADNPNRLDSELSDATRGAAAGRWPLHTIIDSGFGVVTVHYFDMEPDSTNGWKEGIRHSLKDKLNIHPEEWGAIGAWAWGLSRVQDYLEKDKDVDANHTILAGHSRLGKTALWAGANDSRFKIVISNNSGEGGAAISRRMYGENIEHLTSIFGYWFGPEYKNYRHKVDMLPVDQHMLLALIAPRPLYIASAEQDQWADPEGEFLAAKSAEPVYNLYNRKGLPSATIPALNKPEGEVIGYHIRSGLHDVKVYDWEQFIRFAQQHLQKK